MITGPVMVAAIVAFVCGICIGVLLADCLMPDPKEKKWR